jgi:hypothetical protein
MTAIQQLFIAVQSLDRESQAGGLAGYTDSELQDAIDFIETLNALADRVRDEADRRELAHHQSFTPSKAR